MIDPITRLNAALEGRYTIERELGEGGMATVYLAEDLKHHRPVAIKVLDPDVAAEVGADRFLREIETAANLTHPHILPLHDSGESDGLVYYVMPYVEGETLRERIEREQQLPVGDAVRLTCEIADALAYAHERGVIHRDVKPANILLEAGHAVLADFGVAQAVAGQDVTRLTQTGVSLGTPSYMSPEQAAGERSLDGRSDQYALGCVLYEMLAGRPPFTGVRAESVVRQHLVETPTPVTQLRPTVSTEVASTLAKALAKAPADRFGTAAEFGKVLDDQLHTPAAGVPVVPSRSRLLGWRVGAAAVVLVMATAAVVVADRVLRGSDLPEDVVVVIPFSNETGNPAYDLEAKGVAWGIADRLSRSGLVHVVPHQAVWLSWEAALEQRTREPGHEPRIAVAADLGAGTVIGGSILLRSDSIIFDAEITGSGGVGRVLPVDAVVAPLDGVEMGIEAVSETVTAVLAFHRDPAWTEVAPAYRSMPSLSVFRDYVGAHAASRQGDWEESRRLLHRALRQDSTFLPAQTSLAVSFLNLNEPSAADSVLAKAEESYDQMDPMAQAQADWLRATLDGDRDAAYSSVAAMPYSAPLGRLTHGFEALRMNYPSEALEVLSSMDPDSPALEDLDDYWAHLTRALHHLGSHRRELREARKGRARYPDSPLVLQTEIRAQAALGRTEDVTQLVDEASRKLAQPASAFSVAARELRAHGYHEAARVIGERAIAYLRGRPTEVLLDEQHRSDLLRALYFMEYWDDAQVVADSLSHEAPSNLDYLGFLGAIAARRGERAEALRISEALADRGGPYVGGTITAWRASIAGLLGESEQAVSLLRQAHEEGTPFYITHHTNTDLESLRGYSPYVEFMRPKG